MAKNNLTKEFLIEKYVDERLSMAEIARQTNVTSNIVRYRLKKYNIKIDSSRRNFQKKFPIITKEFLQKKYWKENLSVREIASIVGCGKTTIEEYMKKYNIRRRTRSEEKKIKNPMFRQEVRDKVSRWRKENMTDELKEKYSKGVSKAWAEGKFEGVRVGQCEWFTFTKKNGEIIKLQGTWELAFAEWADHKGLKFKTHKGRMPYIFEGKDRNYYPDFFVEDWNCYVDIKNKYHLSLQEEKFKAIRESNPNLHIKILLKKDLRELGVL